jgi:hypothetical protein
MPSPRLAVLAAAAVTTTLALSQSASAQPIPVFLVTAANGSADGSAVNRVSAAIGSNARAGASLARDLRERYGSRAVHGDPLASARDRIRTGERAWSDATTSGDHAAADRALDSLDAAAHEIEAAPEALDANAENFAALQSALVFLAERWDTAGFNTRAADAMRRLARVDPAIAFTARAASPAVQQHYANAVAALPRGAVSVDSAPPGCTVIRDGRSVGSAPVELQDLPQGRHRLQVQCGGTVSLVHPIDVVARTRSTVVIDSQLDSALAIDETTPALHYPTIAIGRARLASDLAILGRALGAQRAYAVIASEDRVVVVDMSASSEVGESPVTDGSRLRTLLTQPVSVNPALAGAGHNTSNTAGSQAVSANAGASMTHVNSGGGSVPVAGIILGVIGLGGIGFGAYATVASDNALNRAEQSQTADSRRAAAESESLWRIAQISGVAAGGALVLTGVLVGIFARDRGEHAAVRAAVAPGWAGVVGTF